jgi:hypothetical protein
VPESLTRTGNFLQVRTCGGCCVGVCGGVLRRPPVPRLLCPPLSDPSNSTTTNLDPRHARMQVRPSWVSSGPTPTFYLRCAWCIGFKGLALTLNPPSTSGVRGPCRPHSTLMPACSASVLGRRCPPSVRPSAFSSPLVGAATTCLPGRHLHNANFLPSHPPPPIPPTHPSCAATGSPRATTRGSTWWHRLAPSLTGASWCKCSTVGAG